jgi:HD superfamily phosphohydrolase
MNEARIIRNEICYPAEHIESVYNIFHSRYKLYKDYYFNVTSKAVELMLADVIRLAEHHFHIAQAAHQLPTTPEPFLRLTDGLVDRIEYAY